MRQARALVTHDQNNIILDLLIERGYYQWSLLLEFQYIFYCSIRILQEREESSLKSKADLGELISI